MHIKSVSVRLSDPNTMKITGIEAIAFSKGKNENVTRFWSTIASFYMEAGGSSWQKNCSEWRVTAWWIGRVTEDLKISLIQGQFY